MLMVLPEDTYLVEFFSTEIYTVIVIEGEFEGKSCVALSCHGKELLFPIRCELLSLFHVKNLYVFAFILCKFPFLLHIPCIFQVCLAHKFFRMLLPCKMR